MGSTITIIVILVSLAVILSFVLIRYGQKLEAEREKEAKLRGVLQFHDYSSEVATNQPATDDDVLDGLRKPD